MSLSERLQRQVAGAFAAAHRMTRGDWSPELHAACDAMEEAQHRLVTARTGDALAKAEADLDVTKGRFGALLLERDKARRPQFHADAIAAMEDDAARRLANT